ncbi:hypothetical protein [Halodesulfurarchaeum sp.]|uniref:hypothetical protein n=1 Tax=Halodesulfurarchaeum sp. TaxID=1980530 RepID=UPI002FC2D5A0
MRSGRNKVLIVGGTFLAVTGAIYGFFVAGIFTAMDIIAHLDVVRYVVAVFAIGFAVVSIKDYFFFGEGVSFTIPDRVKPDVYRGLREAVQTDGTLSTIFATAVMAGGVALIELPCTSGFPVVWSNLVAVHDPSKGIFGALVLVYILLYLAVEIVIIGAAWYSMDRVPYSEIHGRFLKLFAGVVLLGLGIAMVIRPEILENVRETVILFLGAVIFSGLIVWAESVVRENSVV